MAGGGSLVTFPTLVWLGVPSINANATNTVAVWPGTLGSVWGYRRHLGGVDPRNYWLVVPSLAGSLLGAWLLFQTPTDFFDRLVPVLILFATVLFMVQEPVQRRFNIGPSQTRRHWFAWVMFYQLLVSVYGGYFGAGLGILMLAALSLMGHTDIHEMNAFKNFLATWVNACAAIYFVFTGLVYWPDAIVMAAGTVVGGVGGSVVALRIGAKAVRRLVIVIGFVMGMGLLIRAIG